MSRTLFLLLTVWPLLLAATPDSATYRAEGDDLVHFLIITDSHINAEAQSGQKAPDNLIWATGDLAAVVQPHFMVNLGDLTDATGGGLVPLGPQEMEWESYQAIVDANGMTPDFYYDIAGNHDQYLDGGLSHYLDHSVLGRATGQISHSWTRETPFSKVHFLAVATAASDGLPFPEDNAGLDIADLAFIDQALADQADADVLLVLGHHPAAYMEEGKSEFYELLTEAGATAYIHGHRHNHTINWQLQTLHVEIASLGKSSEFNVGWAALDGRGLAVNASTAGQWPLVLVTAPLDNTLGGANLYDYKVPGYLTEAPVRVLAAHPDGVAAVTGLIDGSVEIVFVDLGDGLWQGHFDASALPGMPHELVATATGPDGSEATHAITFYVDHTAEPPEPPVDEDPVVVEEDPTADVISQPDTWEIVPQVDLLAGDDTQETSPDQAAPGLDVPGGETLAGAETAGPGGTPVVGQLPVTSDGGCNAGPRAASPLPFLLLLALLALVRRRPTPA